MTAGGRWGALLLTALALGAPGPTVAAVPNAAVLSAAEAARGPVIDLLKALVNVDSGTGDEAGGRRVLDILKGRLGAVGAAVREEPAEAPGLPPALVAVIKGSGRGRLLLIGHLDTVFGPGTAAARPFGIRDGRAYGPGVGDEKGGVAAGVAVLGILRDLNVHDFAEITFLIDNSEERGSPGATALIKRLAAEADVELNLEPGDPPDAVTVWRKGSATIHIHVKGRAAHAGIAPQDGRNAAQELIHQLGLIKGRFPGSGPDTTVNLTLLTAGSRVNIIPEEADGALNVRFRAMDAFDKVLAAVREDALVREVPDTQVTVALDPAFPPLSQSPETMELAGRAQGIYAEIGRTLVLSGNGGASESALAQGAGAAALDGLGFVGGDFHTDHEWIDLTSVVPRLYLLTRLIMDLGSHPPPRRTP